MRKFSGNMAFVVNTSNNAFIAKLSANINLLRFILFSFDGMNIGSTEPQRDFINSLCVWIDTNPSFSPKQLQSVIQLCLQYREQTESLIEKFNVREDSNVSSSESKSEEVEEDSPF